MCSPFSCCCLDTRTPARHQHHRWDPVQARVSASSGRIPSGCRAAAFFFCWVTLCFHHADETAIDQMTVLQANICMFASCSR